ncbi:MAG: short-subunit dehydrogenase [Mariniblastus sp.]|jgi:short-subunit dehydrogenase
MATWNNKVVVVTGGSEGLGLAISTEFANAGATVVLLARNEARLKTVCESAQANGHKFHWFVGDVTDDESVLAGVAEIVNQHGQIDVWVNNVGKSTRIKFEECRVQDYQELMELNFYSAVRCSHAATEHLAKTSGSVINIGSLAAKTGWPNVAPYTASKHALAAFSHQFRLEGPANVNCLFVCTGPIQRPDSAVRYDGQAKGLSEAARKPGAGVKLKGILPEVLARKIVRSCERRKKELVMPWKARIVFTCLQFAPSLGDLLLKFATKKS